MLTNFYESIKLMEPSGLEPLPLHSMQITNIAINGFCRYFLHFARKAGRADKNINNIKKQLSLFIFDKLLSEYSISTSSIEIL